MLEKHRSGRYVLFLENAVQDGVWKLKMNKKVRLFLEFLQSRSLGKLNITMSWQEVQGLLGENPDSFGDQERIMLLYENLEITFEKRKLEWISIRYKFANRFSKLPAVLNTEWYTWFRRLSVSDLEMFFAENKIDYWKMIFDDGSGWIGTLKPYLEFIYDDENTWHSINISNGDPFWKRYLDGQKLSKNWRLESRFFETASNTSANQRGG
jgi:hypothetical protein